VERLTHSEESGYTVTQLETGSSRDSNGGNFTCIGNPGQTLQHNGVWRDHPSIDTVQICTIEEDKACYLTGLKNTWAVVDQRVGPVTASSCRSFWFYETLDIIENHIERLIGVLALRKAHQDDSKRLGDESNQRGHVLIFLQSHGFLPMLRRFSKAIRQWAIATVTNNLPALWLTSTAFITNCWYVARSRNHDSSIDIGQGLFTYSGKAAGTDIATSKLIKAGNPVKTTNQTHRWS